MGMGSLGLADAMRAYQEGKDWSDRQEQHQRLTEQQSREDARRKDNEEADAVAAATFQANRNTWLDDQKKQWVAGGNKPEDFKAPAWRPDDGTAVQILGAKSDVLAAKGRLEDWTANEAKLAPFRMRHREAVMSDALARYRAGELDGAEFAKTIYPTVHDGLHITSTQALPDSADRTQNEQLHDDTGYAGVALPPSDKANGGRFRMTLSNGHELNMTGADVEKLAITAMQDPHEVARYEFQQQAANILARQKAKADADKIHLTAEEARRTEALRGSNNLAVAGVNGSTRLAAASLTSGATVEAAKVSASARRDAATTAATGRVDAAKERAKGTAAAARKPMTDKQVLDILKTNYGDIAGGAFGSSRVGGPDIPRMATYARSLQAQDSSLGDLEAIALTAEKFGFKGKHAVAPGAAAGAAGSASAPGLQLNHSSSTKGGAQVTNWGSMSRPRLPAPTRSAPAATSGAGLYAGDDEEDSDE